MRRVRLAATLPLVIGAVMLSACSSTPAPTTPGAVDTTAPSSTVKAKPLPKQPDLGKKSQGVAKDVTIAECPTTKGDVLAKGTAKNSAGEKRDLAITVIWLKNNSGDPLGSGIVLLKDVPPGKSKEWTVKATLIDQADRCALHAMSGTLKDTKSKPSSSTSTKKP